ncbi:AraC family transcriptional regulator [Alteromonas sp. 38]|uniref:AraC family transcriptional regulator n=1 Tax=Alteromonas TaxID=226 RepID=UPI0012F463B4|nr:MULTISPECIES: AraC family transcriptional regulator [Alteromonas]CAD5282571.1 AraC family transcriptional regulator [Alteromonas sp. 154]VXB89762.1 AraC family transcriptional regulator [Alteromonas sp. 38]
MRNKSEYGTGCNHYISALYHLSKKIGLDADALLAQANISKDIIDKPEIRVKTESLSIFQKACWDGSKEESMGLLPQRLELGTYYMMGKLTVNQPTLQKALELGARFYNLVTRFEFISVDVGAEVTVMSFNNVFPEDDFGHLFAEMCLLAWHRYASWLIADALPLIETRFNYPSPQHAREYSYLFPGIHRFECASLSLVFPSHYLSLGVKQNESSLKSFMHNCPLELFRQYKADYSVSTEVKRIINRTITAGNTSIDDVAASLYMTTRTIMRRLKEEGSSFQQIKDLVRRDKAITLLTLYSLPIKEVAEKVGYSDPAVFTRAFKSWTGESPRQYRDKYNQSTAPY